MLIFDGDYPMAYSALELNRDLTLPVEAVRRARPGLGQSGPGHPARDETGWDCGRAGQGGSSDRKRRQSPSGATVVGTWPMPPPAVTSPSIRSWRPVEKSGFSRPGPNSAATWRNGQMRPKRPDEPWAWSWGWRGPIPFSGPSSCPCGGTGDSES